MAVRTQHTIFYHIPKTGGVWVREAMRNAGLTLRYCRAAGETHEWGLTVDHAVPADVWPRYKRGKRAFCFVRLPVDWYRSYWCYSHARGARDRRFPIERVWSEDSDEWVNNVLRAFPGGFLTRLYRYYVDDVDYVGRTETLAADLVRVLRQAGEAFDEAALYATPHLNRAWSDPVKGADWLLSPETRRRILDVEGWVLDRFYRGAR